MIEKTQSLKDKLTEQAYLLDVLVLWEVAKRAGYPSEVVRGFSFSEEFMTHQQQRQYRKWSFESRIAYGKKHHNCVRLVTGEFKSIPLMERPYDSSKL